MNDAPPDCPRCSTALLEGHRFCPDCGKAMRHTMAPAPPTPEAPPVIYLEPIPEPPPKAPAPAAIVPAPQPPPPAPVPLAAPAIPAGGRSHSPVAALVLALLIPGAGQAYNGRPIKGFFVLFGTPLVIPWILGIWGAWATAVRMKAHGGRFSPGGFAWAFLQFWLFCNVALAVLLGLTIGGVLR